MSHPPNKILKQYLLDSSRIADFNSTATVSGDSTNWPTFLVLPDRPDNCLAITSTEPIKDGRDFVLGKVSSRDGIQLLLRSQSPVSGWQQIKMLVDWLDENLIEASVDVGSETYKIGPFIRTSGPLDIGRSKEDSRRYLFSYNGILKIIKE